MTPDELAALTRSVRTAYDPPESLDALRDAMFATVRQVRAAADAHTERVIADLDKWAAQWRAEQGRPPLPDPPPDRRDRSQRARWHRRRHADEIARDRREMLRSLRISWARPSWDTDDAFTRDVTRIRVTERIGFSLHPPSGRAIHLTTGL